MSKLPVISDAYSARVEYNNRLESIDHEHDEKLLKLKQDHTKYTIVIYDTNDLFIKLMNSIPANDPTYEQIYTNVRRAAAQYPVKQLASDAEEKHKKNMCIISDETQLKIAEIQKQYEIQMAAIASKNIIDTILASGRENNRNLDAALLIHARRPDNNNLEKPSNDTIRNILQTLYTGDLSQTQFEELLITRAKEKLFEQYKECNCSFNDFMF